MTDKLIIQKLQQLQQDLSYYLYDSDTAENLREEILRLKLKKNEDRK